ncbi:DUF1877 family protein [Streptosporangium sp. NPDC023825]|uniref:DUF1877 family protein n=1 Tax=Streptosporangium sp. NPDC023825 TaxID=3154909 RepID=UPI0034280739
MRLIQADPEQRELASLWLFSPPDDKPLSDLDRRLLATLPEEFRTTGPFPDRSYEQAEYLLDPADYRKVNSWPERERSLPYRIIQGDRRFADHEDLEAPWRCSTTSFLAEAAATIDALDVAAVRQEFSVVEMRNLGVYKVHEIEPDDEVFDRVLDRLRLLAHYYHQLVALDLDLIIATV